MAVVVEGVVAFSNLTKHEEYQGRSTGKYSLVLELSEETKDLLMSNGVNVKEYKGIPQRNFKSKRSVKVIDTEDNPVEGEIPWGSKVRLIVSFGKPSPVYGVTPYLEAVRLVERSDKTAAGAYVEGF
jgi:hypothetical protein